MSEQGLPTTEGQDEPRGEERPGAASHGEAETTDGREAQPADADRHESREATGDETGDEEGDTDFDDALERASGIIADAADSLLRDAGAPLDDYAEEALAREEGEDDDVDLLEDEEEGEEDGEEAEGEPDGETEGEADDGEGAETAEAAPAEAGGRRRRRRRGRGRGREDGARPDAGEVKVAAPVRKPGQSLMLVNDRPGEECRVAILENNRLEALFIERESSATNVGNIYKGRVTNIEPAIQAAFIDFGEGASGFLHISDLHPRYFPGGDKVEKVGKKIPRRERPLMQQALKRGQEILVQVLKEGLGSKGPTVTSYLSIPGRLMVMMPEMGKVGVSRKVEDEEQRRAMRKILDQLDLPEGFGFILRTAGFDRTLGELNRDVAYLKRLWEVMQKRMESTGAPCLLYSEGDLLIRTLRDLADEHVSTVVIDSEPAFRKAKAFLEVVAPTSAPRVVYWDKETPLFHAFDAERQVAMLHSREVPLPSGGALVIDQTEAMVAIDVNSGRSRSARDSETNAYRTNMEAVEEIARQLRLRDLGGVIVNDLIDMRSHKHRREIEAKFTAALRRDRAKTTTAPISDFGVLEMTRQRMRPSVRKTHFMDCPHCHGIGEIKQPDVVAGDALREIEWLFSNGQVKRAELVCSVKVATVLLSTRRSALTRLERTTGKRVDVRISEAIPIDRVDLYAYDGHGADLEIPRLPKPQRADLATLPLDVPESHQDEDDDDFEIVEEGGRRRRRRRRRHGPADTTAMIMGGSFADLPAVDAAGDGITVAQAIEREKAAARAEAAAKDAARKEAQRQQQAPRGQSQGQPQGSAGEGGEPGEGGGRRRRRRRRRGRGRGGEGQPGAEGAMAPAEAAPPPPPPPPSEPMALHVLAKDLGLTSKDLLGRIAESGAFEAKSHMTKLTGEQVDLVRSWFKPPEPEPGPESSEDFPDRGDEGDEGDTETGSDSAGGASGPDGQSGEGGGRRRRRRRRRGRGRGRGEGGEGGGPSQAPNPPRERGESPGDSAGTAQSPPRGNENQGGEGGEGGERRRRRRRRGRGRGGEGGGGGGGGGGSPAPPSSPAPAPAAASAAPKPRSLYGGRVRRLAPGEKPRGGGGDE